VTDEARVTDDDEISTAAREPFAGVDGAFRQAMDAVIELTAFADEHMASLDDVPAAVQQIAAQRLPNATPEQHSAAAAVMIRAFEHAEKDRAEEPTADSEEEAAEEPRPFETVSADIEAIVPGSSGSSFTHYLLAYLIARFRPTRGSVMYSSLLTTAVGNFEVLVSAVVREFLRVRPEAIRSDDAKYSLAEIEGYESIEEFRAYCAERYAENLLRGSFEDWMEWFEKRLKISLSDITSDAPKLREIFQRRHLLVHNGGVVNRLYLNKLSDLAQLPSRGDKLTVDSSYLGASVDRLMAAGVLLQVSVMRKLLPVDDGGKHPADSIAGNAVFDFLGQGRWQLARHVAAASHEACVSDSSRLVMRVNGWIATKQIEGTEGIRAEVEAWQVEPLAPKFRLAKLALLDQVEEAYKMGQELLTSGEIDADDWWTWPLLAEVRDHEAGLLDEAAAGGTPPPAADD
jgi:hypothetical protein